MEAPLNNDNNYKLRKKTKKVKLINSIFLHSWQMETTDNESHAHPFFLAGKVVLVQPTNTYIYICESKANKRSYIKPNE